MGAHTMRSLLSRPQLEAQCMEETLVEMPFRSSLLQAQGPVGDDIQVPQAPLPS